MAMSITELERSLRALRLSGMGATLQVRALAVASHEMDFIEAFSWLVQDELDRRRSRLLDRRYTLSGLSERKELKEFDWSYNPSIPKRAVLELATLKFLDAREDALLIGKPGTGKSHIALGLGLAACQKGLSVGFTNAAAVVHELIEARDEKRLLRLQRQLAAYKLLIIDELGFVPLSQTGAELLFEVFSQRYERGSTIVTSGAWELREG